MTTQPAYKRQGKGSPLLLLPPIGLNWQVWEPIVTLLAKEHTVIAIDLPGLGGNSTPLPKDIPSDVTSLTTAVKRLIKQLKLNQPHVAGNSLGGAIALELARQGVVRSVTAFAPIGFWSKSEIFYTLFILHFTYYLAKILLPLSPFLLRLRVLRILLYVIFFGRPEKITYATALLYAKTYSHAIALKRTLKNTKNYFFRYIPDNTIPITIAWGTRDFLLWKRQSNRAKKILPHAQHIWLKDCGHIPMHDDPTRVAKIILATSRKG